MQVPPVAPHTHVDVAQWIKAPAYEAGGCRFDPCRRHATRRSSVDQSTALRRRVSHVRPVPARPPDPFRARFRTPQVRNREQNGRKVEQCNWEAIRLDQEPVSKTGTGPRGPWAFESPRFRPLAAIVKRTRRRALNPEAGVRLPVAVRNPDKQMPGGPVARTSGCYPEDGSSTLSLAAIARWPRIQARGCRPRHGGESPSRASNTWSSSNGQGSRRAMPAMRVRLPPTTLFWPTPRTITPARS